MSGQTQERVGFEDWLGITPRGAAHDLAYEAFKAGAAWQRAQGAGVPDGWKLVPVIATLEMIDAAVQAIETKQAIWPALLAAAHPAGRQEQGEVQRLRQALERATKLLSAAAGYATRMEPMSAKLLNAIDAELDASTGQEVGK